MKKSWVGLLLCVLAVGYFLWKSKLSGPGPRSKADLSSDQAFDYQISIQVRQKTGAEAETLLISADGVLEQWVSKVNPREYVSEWAGLHELNVMNKTAEAEMRESLLHKLVVSRLEENEGFVDYFGRDFPKDLIPFQVSLLQRILLPFAASETISSSPLSRNEGDEIGIARVRYDLQTLGSGYQAKKTWLRYDQEEIKVDEHDRTIRYEISADERIISAEGKIVLHYREAVPTRYTIELSVKQIGEKPKTLGRIPPQLESMERIGRIELARVVSRGENKATFSYDEVMKKVDQVNEQTSSTEVFTLFSSLRDELNREPERASEVIQKILANKQSDTSTRRRLSILFGALAQTNDPGISTQLAKLVDKCSEAFCRVQAASAVNAHPSPSVEAAKEMLRISDRSPDVSVASAAILAAGSAGRRLEGKFEDLPKHLLKDLADPKKEGLKASILSAMGNHGDSEYLAALQSYSISSDPHLRATAIYSMRFLPQESVNDVLVAAAGDSDVSVASQAYKAMEYRDLPADAFQVLAQKAIAYENMDLQRLAGRIFLQTYREDKAKVAAALETFKNGTKFPEVKEYLETEAKKIDEEQAAGQATPSED